MTINPHDPLTELKITSVVCATTAIGATLYRLWIRRSRYWWDDGFAVFSLICQFAQVAAVFMHVPHPDELSKTGRVAAYYLMATTFYGIIWFARLSILFSVIRIDPSPTMRKRLYCVGGLFGVTFVVLVVQLLWVCEPEPHWKDASSPQCTLNKQVAICQLVSDIISDLLLIFAPLNLIRDLQDPALRRRLVLIFSTSVITTIVSLVHAAYILTGGGIRVVISALVENGASLIVCNLPVIVTAVLRLRDGQDEVRTGGGSPLSRLTSTNMKFVWPSRSRHPDAVSGVNVTTTTVYGVDQMSDAETAVAGRSQDDGKDHKSFGGSLTSKFEDDDEVELSPMHFNRGYERQRRF